MTNEINSTGSDTSQGLFEGFAEAPDIAERGDLCEAPSLVAELAANPARAKSVMAAAARRFASAARRYSRRYSRPNGVNAKTVKVSKGAKGKVASVRVNRQARAPRSQAAHGGARVGSGDDSGGDGPPPGGGRALAPVLTAAVSNAFVLTPDGQYIAGGRP